MAIDRYLNTLPEFSNVSIISDLQFKIADKYLSAELKQLKAQGFAKVQHHPSISPKDIQKCYKTKVFSNKTNKFTLHELVQHQPSLLLPWKGKSSILNTR